MHLPQNLNPTINASEGTVELNQASSPVVNKSVDPIDMISKQFPGTISIFSAIEWSFRPNTPGMFVLRSLHWALESDEAWSLRVCDLTGQLFNITQVGYDVKKCDWIKDGTVIKVAAKTRQQDGETFFIRDLKRELKIWIGLRHEHVVPLFGVANLLGTTVMVCPWPENGTVIDFIASHRDLSANDRVQLISDVADGLRYLHSQSIVHGRLDSSSILVSAQGRAQLSDFGNSTGDGMSTGFISGDIRWTPPEYLFDKGNGMHVLYTLQNDMYSFGSVMYHILSGVIPYHQVEHISQVISKVARGVTPPRPEEPPISDRHWAFIQRCWSFKFKQRSFRPSADEAYNFLQCELEQILCPME